VKLAVAPTVQFAFSGQGSSQALPLQFDARSKSYTGVIQGTKADAEVSIVVSATDLANHTVTRIESLSLTGIDPAVSTTISSFDGALSLTIPAGGAPVGDSAAIGPSPVRPPSLAPGFGVVVGPFNVKISSGEQLRAPGTLRFHLARLIDLPGASGFDPKTFHVLRYDAVKRSWADLGPGVFLAPPLEKVTLRTQQLGVYALVAHFAPLAAGGGPDVSGAAATVSELWPPNHQFVSVGITRVTSPNGPVSIAIDRITSDEPVQGFHPGDPCPDAINKGSTADLRAERLPQGTGRVYTIFFTASDSSGHASSGQVKVCVHLNQADGECVERPATFDATVCP
jgi:hypothetical protein